LNIHNSAFDTGGAFRKQELEVLSHFMIDQAHAGNFVVAGGDWNANPPGFSPEEILTGDMVFSDDFLELGAFFPGWTFAYDKDMPTNRHANQPYEKGKTQTSILDFFLLSPNVELCSIKTVSSGFRYSDHQPVIMTFRAKETDADASPQILE
jgi:endonuclease/exonuclease/phosphatase family metal-dependent hydrolase